MRICEDKTRRPLSKKLPHDGEAVSAASFLSAPDRPNDHTILTAVQIVFLLLHYSLPCGSLQKLAENLIQTSSQISKILLGRL
jgi:hypothetical protein